MHCFNRHARGRAMLVHFACGVPPAAGKTLYFPVVQTCENGRRAWTDIPADGQGWHAVHSPAPFVSLQTAK